MSKNSTVTVASWSSNSIWGGITSTFCSTVAKEFTAALKNKHFLHSSNHIFSLFLPYHKKSNSNFEFHPYT